MTNNPTKEQIENAVANALKATLQKDEYPDRLWPFTGAQLSFMRDFVAQALNNVFEEISSVS